MYKVKCLNNISKVGLEKLGSQYELIEDMDQADLVLVRSAEMKEMEFSDSLLAIARAGAGVNNIPLERCAEKGIVVFNTPGANANGVCEIVLSALFLGARDIIGGVQWVRDNAENPDIKKLTEKQKKQFAGNEIRGKSLGVIGLGAIGGRVANAALDLGMNVLGYDPHLTVGNAWNVTPTVNFVNSVEELYEQADYITIHIPELPSTIGFVSREAIAKMKDGVVFMNFARDTLVDEQAMAEALESGHVKHYFSDFPNTISSRMKNATVTPHLGASTEESEDNCAVMAVEELQQYAECGNIRNSVNFPNCDLGTIKSVARICICHRNVPNMIGQISTTLSMGGVNIAHMIDQSKNEFAYSLIDVDSEIPERILENLKAIPGVDRVRLIRK